MDNFNFFEDDISEEALTHYLSTSIIAVDTETRGLVVMRDRLCLVQICDENNTVSLVRYNNRPAPRLKKLLEEPSVTKLFHFARFDVSTLRYYIKAKVAPIWCTKIASKLVRTYTDRHSLKDLALEMLGVQMDKTSQTSDWARDNLSQAQLEYAAGDVRVLIPIYRQLEAMLKREDRYELAKELFACIPAVAQADTHGWNNIFEH
jgi:ribonuclease D